MLETQARILGFMKISRLKKSRVREEDQGSS